MLNRKLDKNITIASYFGGFAVGALTLMADFLGAIGSGTGILLTTGIIFDVYEEIKRAI